MSGMKGGRRRRQGGDDEEGGTPPGTTGHRRRLRSQRSGAVGATWTTFVPIVEPVVRRSLARRPLTSTAIDDVMQEVWARGLRYGIECESARECYRWATVVAHRIATAYLREQERFANEQVPEVQPMEPSEHVELRATLSSLRQAFPKLSPRDRAVILDAVDRTSRGETKRERDRYSLRLSRARRRLHRLMDGVIVWILFRWRFREDRLTAIAAAGFMGAGLVALSASSMHWGVASATVATTGAPVAAVTAGAAEQPVAHHAISDTSAEVTSASSDEAARTTPTSVRPVRRPPVDVPWVVGPQQIEVKPPPPQLWVEIGTQERQPHEHHALCLRNIPNLGSPCFDLPEL